MQPNLSYQTEEAFSSVTIQLPQLIAWMQRKSGSRGAE